MPINENRRRTKRDPATVEDIGDDRREQRSKRKPKSDRRYNPSKLFLRWAIRGRSSTWNPFNMRLLVFVFVALFVFTIVFFLGGHRQQIIWFSKDNPILTDTSKEFQARYYASRAMIHRYKLLYDQIYKLKEERLQPPDQTMWPDYERNPYTLDSSYGSSIENCTVTILFMDPRLGYPTYKYGPGQSAWFALESIGAFAPDSCVLLQTSK